MTNKRGGGLTPTAASHTEEARWYCCYLNGHPVHFLRWRGLGAERVGGVEGRGRGHGRQRCHIEGRWCRLGGGGMEEMRDHEDGQEDLNKDTQDDRGDDEEQRANDQGEQGHPSSTRR